MRCNCRLHTKRSPVICARLATIRHFGKWHLDGFAEAKGRAAHHRIPLERRGGFNAWIGYENNNAPWDCWVHGHDSRGDEIPREKLNGFETDVLTDLFVSFPDERARDLSPFFGVLSVQPPHDPYAAPERWMRLNRSSLQLQPNVPEVGRVLRADCTRLGGMRGARANARLQLRVLSTRRSRYESS